MRIDEIIDVTYKIHDTTNDCDDNHGIDYSTLVAIESCPFKGIVRNYLGKIFKDGEVRNLALEAGDLCHKVYAVWRALSIKDKEIRDKFVPIYLKQVTPDMPVEMFADQYSNLTIEVDKQETPMSKYMVYADWILQNSGYYNEETDKKRTLENIRDSLMAYCSNFLDLVENEPVWISEDKQTVGIELPFNIDLVITYKSNDEIKEETINFIGKIDGIHMKDGKIIIHENKTASRLDDAWLAQWIMAHQITGYCFASMIYTGEFATQARVLGMQIPVPKYSGYAFRSERVDREQNYVETWLRWMITQYNVLKDYKDYPEKAVMNTKSCCAYYSQCNYLCLCTQSEEERKHIIENEMITKLWSPLNE